MSTPAWLHLFIGVPRPAFGEAVEFWACVTGATASPRRGEEGQFVTLLPSDGSPWVKVQAVGGDGGVHLDVDAADTTVAATQALADHARDLGARPTTTYDDVLVMRSPGGLAFCVSPGVGEPRRLGRNDVSVLDQVCIDIPAPLWDTEVAFWRELTGREMSPSSLDDYAGLTDPDPTAAARILLQRTGSHEANVRAHPDFAVTDRPDQEARHLVAGAELIERFAWWTVLRAPGGQVYCLTDRDPATGRVRPRTDRPPLTTTPP